MDPLTPRVFLRHAATINMNAIDELRKDIERFRTRVRRLQFKLQADLYGKGAKPSETEAEAIAKKAVADAHVVLDAVKKADELVVEASKDVGPSAKLTEALAYLKKQVDIWQRFLADPKGYREKSNHSYASDKGTPVDIVVDLWTQAGQTADAMRQAANAVFYAKKP